MTPPRYHRPASRSPKTSRFFGVTCSQPWGKYDAFVKVDGRRIHLGTWRGERDAAVARDRAVLYFALDDRKLNLPTVSAKLGPASPSELRRLSRLDWKKVKSSKYLGVIWHARSARWAVSIGAGQRRTLQVAKFDDERDAAAAYDRVALHTFGKRALLNFPESSVPGSVKEVRREAWMLSKLRKTSQYRGVSWSAKESYWVAQIGCDHKRYRLGRFASEQDAALAYDRAATKFFGSEAMLNFPAGREHRRPGKKQKVG